MITATDTKGQKRKKGLKGREQREQREQREAERRGIKRTPLISCQKGAECYTRRKRRRWVVLDVRPIVAFFVRDRNRPLITINYLLRARQSISFNCVIFRFATDDIKMLSTPSGRCDFICSISSSSSISHLVIARRRCLSRSSGLY